MPGYKIFISSTMDDLQEERQKIAIAVMKSENIPIMAENMIDVINTPRKALEEKIDECDGYIGIFHKKWGYVPSVDNPDKLSIMAIEYERAKERKIPQLILISNYEKDDDRLGDFIEKISNMEEGRWRNKYTDSNDLILKVTEGIPHLIKEITSKQSKTQSIDHMKSSDHTLHISAIVSNPHEITGDIIEDIPQDTIDSYAKIITASLNPDVRQVAWNYLNKLAENKRLWNHDKIWMLLDNEIIVTAPTQFFFNATSILKWMLRNSEKDSQSRGNPLAKKVRQKYLTKVKEILGSPNGVWDSYHRTEIKQILKGVTEPKERCKIWWEAWKSCARRITDTTEYTHLTQSVSVEVENSDDECRNSIRMEQLSIIENGDPPFFAQRAQQLHI